MRTLAFLGIMVVCGRGCAILTSSSEALGCEGAENNLLRLFMIASTVDCLGRVAVSGRSCSIFCSESDTLKEEGVGSDILMACLWCGS